MLGKSKSPASSEIFFYSRKPEYGWLSNFHRAPQRVDNIQYPTNEHYYQSQKAITLELRQWIKNAPSPYQAMMAGRSLRENEVVPDWNAKKLRIMRIGLHAKFAQNEDLKALLLGTGNALLHEDSPNDKFWGVRGQDMLGKLLMELRSNFGLRRIL